VLAVAIVLGAGLLAVRVVTARLAARHWPPAAPVVRLAAGYRAPSADRAQVRTFKGTLVPLAWALAVRGQSLERAVIGDLLQPTLYAPAPTTIERKVTLPAGARLLFDYGLLRDAWNWPGGRVRFTVTVTTARGRRLARWSDIIDTSYLYQRRWRSAQIDLSHHAGERAVLRFVTRGVGLFARSRPGGFAMWGDPTLLGADAHSRTSSRPNIILIVVDALRADRVGCHGHAGRNSPHMDALALQGLRFAYAFAQASWTLPSVASILASRYPGQIRDTEAICLAPDVVTFPQLLTRHGYVCAAITANPVAHWGARFDRGFEYFDDRPFASFAWRAAEQMTRDTISWLRQRSRQPFFLYLHYIDPHDPYLPPYPKPAAPVPRTLSSAAVAEGRARIIEDDLRKGRIKRLSPNDVRHLLALYDGEVRYADQQIGRLLAELRSLRLLGNTAIILTADHGEELYDHAWVKHGHSLYREVLHVPLIIVAAGASGGRVIQEPVGLIDIGATVLDVAGIQRRFGLGESLLGFVSGGRARARPVFSQLGPWHLGRDEHTRTGRSLVSGRWHLIRSDDGAVELYDLFRDPAEKRNLARIENWRVKQMTAQLEELSRPAGNRPTAPGPRPKIDDEMKRRLRSLGYIQ
jgi:arylsulfatase A-like enzyme